MNTPDNVNNNPRPKLSDPKEFALIKKIYFQKDDLTEADQEERIDRNRRRNKTKIKQSR